tara:strand:+ start:4684 stop:5292 length:609 start_codon:yes stop_codon:yes gene_type:complete
MNQFLVLLNKMIIFKNINQHKTPLFPKSKNIIAKWGFSKKGIFLNSKGEWYLFLQMLFIALHLMSPYPKIENIAFPLNIFPILLGILVSIKGLVISIKGLIDLGDNLTPLPYPMKETILIRNNSYNLLRHPIYKGLLLISLGICFFKFSLLHFFLFISLAFVIRKKALKEEEMLKIKFPEYRNYIKDVPAIFNNIKFFDWRS